MAISFLTVKGMNEWQIRKRFVNSGCAIQVIKEWLPIPPMLDRIGADQVSGDDLKGCAFGILFGSDDRRWPK